MGIAKNKAIILMVYPFTSETTRVFPITVTWDEEPTDIQPDLVRCDGVNYRDVSRAITEAAISSLSSAIDVQ